MIRGLERAGLVVLCCLGLVALGSRPCFAGEYVLDEDYSTSLEGVDTSIDWDYIPENMTFDEWQEWEPTAGELKEYIASASEASPSSVGPSLRSSYPDVYDGSISTTQLSYFSGIVRKFKPGIHYVLFRQSRYQYRLVYSPEMIYENGFFRSSDTVDFVTQYVLYNTDTNTVSEGKEGTFSLTPLSYPVYTDLGEKYPILDDGGRVYETKTLLFVLMFGWLTSFIIGFFRPGRYRWG